MKLKVGDRIKFIGEIWLNHVESQEVLIFGEDNYYFYAMDVLSYTDYNYLRIPKPELFEDKTYKVL